MLPLFKTSESAIYFVDNNLDRKRRNLICRRVRFSRQAYNQEFNFFVTLTHYDGLHTEQTFRKKLLRTISHFAERKGWRYMGVWERGKKTDRLHFHGLFYIPDGTLKDGFIETTDYNYKTHKKRTILQSVFFLEKYGRNEFEELDKGTLFGHALAYIMKYMEKTNERVIYSKGLYQYFHTDLQDDDVLCAIHEEKPNSKLVLYDKFTCIDEGEIIGEVSPDTIAKLPKSN